MFDQMIFPKTKRFRNAKELNLDKRLFIVFFLVIFSVLFLYANNVFSQEKMFVCPLKKMANVGGLTDQTAISVNEILSKTLIILNNSKQAYQAAGDLITISQDECKPQRCTSSCQTTTDYTACNTTTCKTDVPCCKTDYSCDSTDKFERGSSFSNKITSCSDLSKFSPVAATWYAEFNYKYHGHNLGQCYNKACDEDVCEPVTARCSDVNEACPFGEIRNKVGIVETALINITSAYNRINDFFNKQINQFPEEIDQSYQIFGKFNEHPILSKLCVLTDFFGINPCGSEFNALVAIKDKAKENMKSCDIISSDDLFEGKQGESLFVCKDVSPEPIRQCWRNDFFCCSSQ